MIQELKVSNFLSFKEEVTFSFEATKDSLFEDYHVVEVAPDVRLLRFAMIYGANASGKSNLLQVEIYVNFGLKQKIIQVKQFVPFRLDTDT
jgi:AAA15 family ATPase/GTPase